MPICAHCKKINHVTHWEPVYPPHIAPNAASTLSPDIGPDSFVYRRWACLFCRRYHHADGTLWTNPYKGDTTTNG